MAENQTLTAESNQDPQTIESGSKPLSRTKISSAGTASSVLPFLVDSPERRQLAKDLEHLLRDSKIEEAESRLNKAVDLGTFALMIIDQLRTPSFLVELQALGLQDDNQSTALPAAAAEGIALPAVGTGETHGVPASDELARLKAARDREQQRADALAHDLAAVTEELQALRVLRTNEAAIEAVNVQHQTELKASFEKERERADAATRDLAIITKEIRTLQKSREQDDISLASTRRELQDLKGELERERQRNQAASAVLQQAEQSSSSKIEEPIDKASHAPAPRPSSPGLLQVRAVTVQANSNRVRGVPNVLDTATLSLQGRTVHLFGVQTDGDVGSASELTKYLSGREVDCEPAGPTDVYQCRVDGMDLSTVVLFNGGGRAAPDATPGLTLAADRARSAGVGVWSK